MSQFSARTTLFEGLVPLSLIALGSMDSYQIHSRAELLVADQSSFNLSLRRLLVPFNTVK
jgi:hypothetical protein